MGRWRPPSPHSSPYITPEGYLRLQSELEQLWKKRAETTAALAVAAAEGDRSENAEYIYRKKELREIDYRLRYLQKRLPKIKIVRETGDPSRVFFGATVTVESEEGEALTYRIVGADEIDHEKYNISIDSPMAKGMIGKAVDAEFNIRVKDGMKRFWVVDIRYQFGPD